MSERDSNTRELIDSLLHDMSFHILNIQEKYVSLASNSKLSKTEIHIVDIVGNKHSSILSNVARELNITLATASVAMDRLVNKGLVSRRRMDFDRRKFWLELTDAGWDCYNKHKEFHDELIDELLEKFNPTDYPLLLESLAQLNDFFKLKLEEVRLAEIQKNKSRKK